MKKCPHCKKVSLSVISAGSKPSPCSVCGGLVRMPNSKHMILFIPLIILVILVLPMFDQIGRDLQLWLGLGAITLFILAHLFLVPVLPVENKDQKNVIK